MTARLICPSTGEVCVIEAYCSGLMELRREEISPQTLVEVMDVELAAEFVQANKEFCSERKLKILQDARDDSHDRTTIVLAGLMIDNINDSREKYRT